MGSHLKQLRKPNSVLVPKLLTCSYTPALWDTRPLAPRYPLLLQLVVKADLVQLLLPSHCHLRYVQATMHKPQFNLHRLFALSFPILQLGGEMSNSE
jgi:hypothetical protein